ncbi:MAG: 1-deoxy-D-xylulose-5-phosphate reductoisomerase [Sporichthyaceae bacterium]
MSAARDVVILGSTGSIGTQALDVVRRNPKQFNVVGLGAGGGNIALLAAQAVEFGVQNIAVADAGVADDLRRELFTASQRLAFSVGRMSLPTLLAGPDALTELAGTPCDVVLNGITGSVGLRPTLAALRAGSVLALANKESLIVGGPLVTALAAPGQIVAVDSEHSALAQCLRSGRAEEVARLVLTASGGPFRGKTRADLAGVKPQQALAHPTWAMGPVVTINSATLMNKGLELIEAHLLFDVDLDRIDVVVHPQSVIHSMVAFVDGSTIAQASPPDMRLPIAHALAWPDRVPGAAPGCDFSQATAWTFEPLDNATFPAVELARECGRAGGTKPAVFNAANEECVAGFLAGTLDFLAIVDTVAEIVGHHENCPSPTLDDVLAAESWAREQARRRVTTQ